MNIFFHNIFNFHVLLPLVLSLTFNIYLYSQNPPIDDSKNIIDILISPPPVTNFSHSENSVFISPVNPDVILNSNMAHSLSTNPPSNFGLSAQFSSDGGLTWPVPDGVKWQLNSSLADPAVVIGLDGKMYIGYINRQTGDQNISIYSGNGQTWNEYTVAFCTSCSPQSGLILDKNHLWIDNRNFNQDNTINIFKNHLYAAWTDLGSTTSTPNELIFSVSDNGQTWPSPPCKPGFRN